MNRRQNPRCKMIRAYGTELVDTLSGVRPLDQKCNPESRRKRLSDYGVQLREKMKLRKLYDVLERPFRNLFKEAARLKGSTGENLLMLLECRLKNVVYRAGFATTRAEARQLINHKHILVNDQIVNIASFKVKVGDVVAVRDRSKQHGRIVAALELAQQLPQPEWLDINAKAMTATVKRLPERSDLPPTINESLVVELYSK